MTKEQIKNLIWTHGEEWVKKRIPLAYGAYLRSSSLGQNDNKDD